MNRRPTLGLDTWVPEKEDSFFMIILCVGLLPAEGEERRVIGLFFCFFKLQGWDGITSPRVSRMGEKDSTNQPGAGTRAGHGGRGVERIGGRSREKRRKRKKEKPSSAPCRIVPAQPFSLLSAFSSRGENVTLA